MASLTDIANTLTTSIIYDERTKRFHDMAMNYRMVSSERARRELTAGVPNRIGDDRNYVTQSSFDALRRDVYAMMSSIAENSYLASNELRRMLVSQQKDTQRLLNRENRNLEDRAEGNDTRGNYTRRIGNIASAIGRGTRSTIRNLPNILGGLGLAGLATALAATQLSPELIQQIDEFPRQILRIADELMLAAEITGAILGSYLAFRGFRAINRFSQRLSQRIFPRQSSPAATRPAAPPAPSRPAPPAPSRPAPPAPSRPPPTPPRPGVQPRVSPPGRPPERIPAPPVEGGRTPTSRPATPASGRPIRVPGAGIARMAGNIMIGLAPSIVYYMTTTSEQREVADIEELGENARNYAFQFERATTELNRLQGLPETDPGRSTLVIQANQQQIVMSRREVDNQIRRLEHARNASRERIRNYERSISTERNNPYGANQNTINEAQNQLDRHQRRIELAEAYLTETRGLRLMMNNSELVREMPTSAGGRLTEEQRQHAAIALGQGTLSPERLAAMVTGREAIELPPPIVVHVRRQIQQPNPPPPAPAPAPPSAQARPSGNPPP